jgi:hypothetical protein
MHARSIACQNGDFKGKPDIGGFDAGAVGRYDRGSEPVLGTKRSDPSARRGDAAENEYEGGSKE